MGERLQDGPDAVGILQRFVAELFLFLFHGFCFITAVRVEDGDRRAGALEALLGPAVAVDGGVALKVEHTLAQHDAPHAIDIDDAVVFIGG